MMPTGPAPQVGKTSAKGCIVAVVLAVVGLVVMVATFVVGGSKLLAGRDELRSQPLLGTGEQTYTLDAGPHGIWSTDATGALFGTKVEVTEASTGNAVTVTPVGGSGNLDQLVDLPEITDGSTSYVRIATFTAPSSGQYRFTTTKPDRTRLAVGPADAGSGNAGGVVVFSGLIVGIGLFVAGLVVAVVWLVYRSRSGRRPGPSPGGYPPGGPGYGYPQPGYQPPPAPQPGYPQPGSGPQGYPPGGPPPQPPSPGAF